MKRAQKICYVVASVFATYALAGSAAAQDSQPPQQQPQQQTPSRQKAPQPSDQQGMDKEKQDKQAAPGEVMAARMSLTATVDKIDMKKRQLTLKDDSGNQFKVDVPPDVQDFKNIKKGDKISIDYYSSVALKLQKPGAAGKPGMTETEMAAKEPAKLPGGIVARKITATAEVMKVDTSANTVTIKGPGGELDTIKVDDPDVQADLGKLKKGDKIKASYTEAVAISITPAQKMGQGPQVAPEKTPDQAPEQKEPKTDTNKGY
ncbi:MAG TPA: hypothetical protein VFV99_16535 [Kofleriaceae bacterium]|nr:hypothetical protein [Kofleriaceae bacterium]